MIKNRSRKKINYFVSARAIVIILILFSVVGAMSEGFKNKNTRSVTTLDNPSINTNIIDESNKEKINKDSVESVAAFMKVYSVLMSPRCMNCHPAGDQPLQDTDHRIHFPPARRAGLGDSCADRESAVDGQSRDQAQRRSSQLPRQSS